MVRASPIQTSFNAGELSPKLEGRVDINRYGAGLQIMENFIAEVQGGAARRPGTRYVAPVRYPGKQTYLLPFQYSTEQAYILEIGDLYVRFYRNHGPLLETSKPITGATQGNPVVITATGHGYANGDDVEISGVAGMTTINGRRFRVAGVTANTFQLTDPISGATINGTSFPAYVSGGTVARVYTLTTTYQEQDLSEIKFAQSADVLYLVHPEYVPRKLSRLGATNWSLAQIDFADGPYLPMDLSQATITPSAASGAGITLTAAPSITITGAANNGSGGIRLTAANHGWNTGDVVVVAGVTGTTEANGTWTVTRITANTFDLQGSAFANAYVSGGTAVPRVFQSTDIGRLVRIQHSSTWGYARIVSFTSATSVTADVINAFGATTASKNWRLGLYSQGGGYPSAVSFFEDRLGLGGCPLAPQRIDLSVTASYENYAPSDTAGVVADSNACSFTLNSGDVNVIRWMKDDEKGLLAGTIGGEWVVRSNTLGDALTPSNIKATRSSTFGSANYQPVRAGKDVIFIQRGQRKVRNLSYVFENDGFSAGDTTILSEHITLGGCQQMTFQPEPNSIVWIVRGGGQLLSQTYSRDQETIGWARQIFGGFADVFSQTPAACNSVASIPSPDTTRDESWVIVQRYINGQSCQYVEWMTPDWIEGGDQETCFFVDAGAVFDGAVSQTLTFGNGAYVKGTTGVTFTAGGAVFQPTDTGRVITYRYYDYATGTYQSAKAEITAHTSATVVTCKILAAFPSTVASIASGAWRLSAQTITGLWHLEGQTVSVLGEGATHPEVTVTNGSITLDRQVAYAVVGLMYRSSLQTLRIDAGAADGTSQGKKKRISEVVVRLHQTLGGLYGPDFDQLDRIEMRDPSVPMDQPPPLQNGDFTVKWDKGYETDGRMCFVQNQPLPMTILAIMPQVVTTDKGG